MNEDTKARIYSFFLGAFFLFFGVYTLLYKLLVTNPILLGYMPIAICIMAIGMGVFLILFSSWEPKKGEVNDDR